MVSTNFANGKAVPAMMDADPLDQRIAGLTFLSLCRRAFCQQRRFADKSCRSKKNAGVDLKKYGRRHPPRFIFIQAASIHEDIKQKVEMNENQTRLIFRTYKNTARVYDNGIADKVVAIEAAGGDFGQVHHLVSGANQEKAWSTGDIEAGMVTVGMCGGLINDIPTCEQLVNNIVADAEAIIRNRLAGMIAG